MHISLFELFDFMSTHHAAVTRKRLNWKTGMSLKFTVMKRNQVNHVNFNIPIYFVAIINIKYLWSVLVASLMWPKVPFTNSWYWPSGPTVCSWVKFIQKVKNCQILVKCSWLVWCELFCLDQENLQRPLEFIGKLIEHHTHRGPDCRHQEFANRTLGVMLSKFAYEF